MTVAHEQEVVAMTKEFKLPDIGEGVHEGEITKWMVKEGASVREDDPMVEVMTDKVTVQIPSPYAGKVLKILAKEGETVKVGTTIIVIGEEGETVTPDVEKAMPLREHPPPPPPRTSEGPRPEFVLATPAVRKLARDMGVNIEKVRGTGPLGRVTEDDVRGFSAQAAPEPAPPAPPTQHVTPAIEVSEREERIPVKGIRKKISEKMHMSKTTAAHFTYIDEVDMTNIVHLRERLLEIAEKKKVKLTYLPFIVKALIAGLKEHPTLNSSLDDERQEIVMKKYYNIGVAVATDQGLIVPVVKDADGKDIWQIARDIEELADHARTGKLRLEDVQGGTITVTSLGADSGIMTTPVINWPEAAIISVNKIDKRPVVVNDQIVIRQAMNLSVSFDHRIIDGHIAAAFTKTMIKFLEHPTLLFLGHE